MGKIKKILEKELGSTQSVEVYPVTSIEAVYDENNERLDNIINRKNKEIQKELKAEVERASNAESNLRETINNITEVNENATSANIVTIDNIPNTSASNVQQALNELFKNATFAGIAKPTTNPGVPDGNVFYLAGEGSYPNFNNQVVGVGQIAVLKWDGSWHKEVLEIGTDGGNMTLEWNTDVETTRKQVQAKFRKPGIQISYKDPEKGWTNEQYIGTSVADTEWGKHSNWISIPNASQISELSSNILEIGKSLSNSKTFLFTYADCTTVGILNKNGTVNESYTNGKVSDFVEIKGNWIIDAVNTYPLQQTYVGLVLTKEDKTTIVGVFGGTFKIDTKDYPEAKYMRYCFTNPDRAGITISQNLAKLDKVQENVDSVSNILKLNDEEKYINVEIEKINKAGAVIGDIVGFNHPLDADSYLQSIYISETEKVIGDTALAYVGIIDQYNLFVVSKTIECTVTGIQFGSIILEPNSPCLINRGEIVLVGIEKSRWNYQISYPEYGGNPVKVPKSTFMAVKSENCPSVFVVNVRKIVYKNFASKQEVDNINNEISAIKNQFTLHDEGNGNNYKVIVYNGELKLKLLAYNKILCIGNSFTYSPKRSSWPEEGRNMLASVNSSQYVEMIKLAANAEKVDKLFARSFEYAANDTSIDTYNFESELPITDDYDAIIIQLGENNKGTYKSWTKLYQYVRSKCPTADIFHVTGWFSPTDNIVKAASEQKVTTIDCSKECGLGNYSIGDFIKADNGSNFEINNAAVSYHPSDYGFYGFARKILYTLGIDTKKIDDKIHNITISETANGVVTTPYNQWYEGGIVNIRITANEEHSFSQITVTGAGGTTYQADVIDGTKGKRAIFPMPNEDVTINVIFI